MKTSATCIIKKTQCFSLMMIVALGFAGCSSGPFANGLSGNSPTQSTPGSYDPAVSLVYPEKAGAQDPNDGSLWRESAPLVDLFSDQKARGVGDIVTIRIVESSTATNKASTDTERTSSAGASIDAFFGSEKKYQDSPFFNPFGKLAGQLESEFEGEGTTKRSGALTAHITAMITQVLPNGNLVLTGSREVLVNNENQIITLTGVVRPRDISASNQVLSTYVADARIAYSGSGVVNDRQRTGWLTNLLMFIWPF
ncbi:flagellar basal body L-ring protein FlgH [Desulfosarcina sp. OttesenSCG-928-G10]|nr:flagellar basal body L-ring protein FlgH [Desulfosarcina sp. OttesenSCG-928-G10]